MLYKPLAVKVALVECLRLAWPVLKRIPVVVAGVGMWESRRDFQRVSEDSLSHFKHFFLFRGVERGYFSFSVG
jgi:hypothetical protein